MSMEMYVLSNRTPTSMAEWQAAIDAGRYPLRLSASTTFDRLQGALPAMLDNKPVSFECDHWSVADVLKTFSDVHVGGPWSHALSFRWGADMVAARAAYLAAAAYAVASDGVILDGEEAKIISVSRAIAIASEIEQQGPLIEDAIQQMLARLNLKK